MVVKKDNLQLFQVQTLDELQKLSPSFEEVYQALEQIIASQENNSIPLVDSINQYKLGKIYVDYCQNILENATLEIEKIDKNAGN